MLSIKEAMDLERFMKFAAPTDLARPDTRGKNGNAWYWLRSSGTERRIALNMSHSGVNRYGLKASTPTGGVRPAIVIDLSVEVQ